MKKLLLPFLLAPVTLTAQTLVDSLSYQGVNQSFWGIHVTSDTIFLGADGPGDVVFSDHDGNILGNLPTGYTFNHGLVRKPSSYLIAQDYTTNGAHLYEIGLDGALLNTWTFPDVIGGHSSGIGDLCLDGDAVWYTMYYPDFDVFPYAYAYKWIPGDPAPIDTVPMHGEQPYGIALRGDTLFYVTDNLNGDLERIYAYDLSTGQDIGSTALPDSDNDQSPHGMHYDGSRLYLVANRSGGSAFAFQTIFIYDFDASTAVWERDDVPALSVFPNPAKDLVTINNPLGRRINARLFETSGRVIQDLLLSPGMNSVDISSLAPGLHLLRADGIAPVPFVVR
ncbi:MAG: T9SS type A sorting domain-containing protein [Flavobacteriales bacterium]|nr:T9SS type A sorting domain-containing protein [Flavobacteriales bacterium]